MYNNRTYTHFPVLFTCYGTLLHARKNEQTLVSKPEHCEVAPSKDIAQMPTMGTMHGPPRQGVDPEVHRPSSLDQPAFQVPAESLKSRQDR